MSSFYKKSICVLGISFCFLLCCYGQALLPGPPLHVIETQYFDIIFPEDARVSAEEIASFADRILLDITGRLDLQWDERIPVTISPYTEKFNGYMNSFPYSHIVLYDAPPDIEFSAYRNSLESLFVHELVHVVSLSTRSPFLQSLYRVFGGWVMPAAFTAPMFMVEGVTVSFESLDGFGRANDPVVRHRLSQAYYEGSFLSPAQVSGTYDQPPFSKAYYEYGGMFSAWLQETYGMEKYALLWKKMGRFPPLSLRFYHYGLYPLFERVYGMPFTEAWSAFSQSFFIAGIRENTGSLFTEDPLMVNSVASDGAVVYFLDRYTRSVMKLDPQNGSVERAVKTDSTAESISISPDGQFLLVSGYRLRGEFAKSVVFEYETKTGKKTGRFWEGIQAAAYFRGGIVGLSNEGQESTLVYYGAGDLPDVFLRGNSGLNFSKPVPLDERRIAFVAADKGIRELCLYDSESGETLSFSMEDEQDRVVWHSMLDLSAADGELLFSWNDRPGLYKLARLAFPANGSAELILYDENYSGGVFSPVRTQYGVVYLARFSSSDALARYPESGSRERKIPVSLSPRIFSSPQQQYVSHSYTEKKYAPLSYINPFDLWFPFPLIRDQGDSLHLDGGGIVSYMATPTDMNVFLVFAGYDAREQVAALDATWVSFSPGFPLMLRFTDQIEYLTDSFSFPYRETRATASVAFTRGIKGERIRYTLTPSFEAVWCAFSDSGGHAYTWKYGDGSYLPGFGLTVSNRDRLPWELFGRGVEGTIAAKISLPQKDVRTDAVFRAAAGRQLPVRLTVYSARDESGMDIDGSSVVFSDPPWSSAAAVEYAGDTDILRWVSGAEAEICFFSVDVHRTLSHIYANRFFGILAWRGVLYGDEWPQTADLPGFQLDPSIRFANSVVLKTGAVVTLLPVPMMPVRLTPEAWLAWKLADGNPFNPGESLAFGITFAVEW